VGLLQCAELGPIRWKWWVRTGITDNVNFGQPNLCGFARLRIVICADLAKIFHENGLYRFSPSCQISAKEAGTGAPKISKLRKKMLYFGGIFVR